MHLKTSDVVVIGGGIMGASATYHLMKRGGVKVTLVEKAPSFGEGSTGKCAGGIRHQFSTEVNIRLSIKSTAMLQNFVQELDHEAGLKQIGYLFLLDQASDLAQFEANVALQNRLGVNSMMIPFTELATRLPYLNLEGILGGSFCQKDGLADPHSVVQGYIKAARRLGAYLLTDTTVFDIDMTGHKINKVKTSQGDIATNTIVIANGAWARPIGDMIGLNLPIQPVCRQIAVTRALPELKEMTMPFILFFNKALYFHPEGEGILTGMSNAAQIIGFDETVDPAWTLTHLEEAMYRFPLLEKAQLLTQWAGLYAVTPDHQAILGRLPGIETAICVAGFSGHGFMHGPICGLLMAEEILDGRAQTVNIDDLRYDRFMTPGVDVREFNVI